MRIGIDARPLQWPGIGRVTHELLHALRDRDDGHEYFVYLRNADDAARYGLSEGFNVRVVPANPYSIAEQLFLPWRMLRDRLDLLHAPTSLVVPMVQPCPIVITVHDLLYKTYPEYLPSRLGALYFALTNARALRSARRIIAVSGFTASELGRLYPDYRDKVRVVHNGVSASFRPVTDETLLARAAADHGLDGPFILYVGTLKHHKDVPTLIRAFAALPDALREKTRLALVTRPDPRYPETEALIARHRLEGSIRRIAPVDESTLHALYSSAAATVMPSHYEGFGLPIVEAMACGCPVVASRIPVFEELTGDAALTFAPGDARSLCEAMQRVLTDPDLARELSERGQHRVRQFDWRDAARRTVAIYAEAAGARRGVGGQ